MTLEPTPSSLSDTSTVTSGAGFRIRAVARLLDDWVLYWLLRFLTVLVLAVAAGVYRGFTATSTRNFMKSLELSTPISWVGGAIAVLCYHTLSEGIGGATIGKRLVGLKVVDESLMPCTLLQGFKRSLAFYYDGLFFGLVVGGLHETLTVTTASR
jgi:uncharacterized RDD family membrane protein YckC